MRPGFIAGKAYFVQHEYPKYDGRIDEETGEWVVCPECGSEAAGFRFWNEGVDMDFNCPDCGAHRGVR